MSWVVVHGLSRVFSTDPFDVHHQRGSLLLRSAERPVDCLVILVGVHKDFHELKD